MERIESPTISTMLRSRFLRASPLRPLVVQHVRHVGGTPTSTSSDGAERSDDTPSSQDDKKLSLGGMTASTKASTPTVGSSDAPTEQPPTAPPKLKYSPIFAFNRTSASFERKRGSVWAAINYMQVKKGKADGNPIDISAIKPLADDHKGYLLFDDAVFLVPAGIRNYIKSFQTMIALGALGTEKRSLIKDCLKAAPALFDAIFGAIQERKWDDLAAMCTDPALAYMVQERYEGLSDRQRQIFDMHQRDIKFPNMAFFELMPENMKPMAQIVFLELYRTAGKDSGRRLRVHMLYECIYRRWDVLATFPHTPKDYAYSMPKFVFPNVVLTMDIDEEDAQWKIDDFNVISMP